MESKQEIEIYGRHEHSPFQSVSLATKWSAQCCDNVCIHSFICCDIRLKNNLAIKCRVFFCVWIYNIIKIQNELCLRHYGTIS